MTTYCNYCDGGAEFFVDLHNTCEIIEYPIHTDTCIHVLSRQFINTLFHQHFATLKESSSESEVRSESSCALRLRYSAVYRDRPRKLNELKTTITAYIRNISQADLEKVFANKIERVQACIDARGHHFQLLL
jgi:hypothetical protein